MAFEGWPWLELSIACRNSFFRKISSLNSTKSGSSRRRVSHEAALEITEKLSPRSFHFLIASFAVGGK